MIPTLVVNTDMIIRAGTVCVYNSGEASERVCLGLQSANTSRIPALAISVGKLLNNAVGVEVVHANLLTHTSGRVPRNFGAY